MFWLFRRFCTLLGFLVLCLACLFYTRNLTTKWLLSWLLPHCTTFGCTVAQANVEATWPLRIHLTGVTIENPPDFPERLAMEIPQASLVVAPSGWQNQGVAFSLVELQISRLNLVNTEPGANNLNRFLTVARRNETGPSYFAIESLDLRITDPRYARLRRYSSVNSQKKLAAILFEALSNSR